MVEGEVAASGGEAQFTVTSIGRIAMADAILVNVYARRRRLAVMLAAKILLPQLISSTSQLVERLRVV